MYLLYDCSICNINVAVCVCAAPRMCENADCCHIADIKSSILCAYAEFLIIILIFFFVLAKLCNEKL